jgi:hypothetical protein
VERLFAAAVALNKHGYLQRDALGAPPVKFRIAVRILGFGALRLSPLQRIVNPAHSLDPLSPAAGLPENTVAYEGDLKAGDYWSPCE